MNANAWEGADLVMEIVSESNRKHDLETKRAEYAQAGIPEYWLIDPNRQTITVLKLKGRKYVEHAENRKGTRAASASLPGFEVDVRAALDAK